jgi:hypothetical protein
MLRLFVTSMIRSSLVSKIADNTEYGQMLRVGVALGRGMRIERIEADVNPHW